MKKIKILVAAVAALYGSSVMSAQDRTDSLKVFEKADSSASLTIEKGRAHLDFDIPFYNKIKNRDDEALIGAIGVGSLMTNARTPLDFSPQNSLEFYLYALDSHTKGHSTFSYGPGITFRNFAMTGGTAMMLNEQGNVSFGSFPSGSVPKVSKLKVFSVNAPLLYSYSFGGGFGFTLGPVVNLNAGSSIVNKYMIDREKQKDKYKNAHCNIVTVDAMFQLNLKIFSIYVKYSPMSVMDKKYWPDFQTWSIGIAPF